MIVREMPNGQLLCINQTSHALMSAEFCRHWGNSDFTVPAPFAEVLLGVAQHDNGWYEWELKPKLRPDGYPMDFLHDPDVLGKLNLWRRSVNRAYEQHPYAAVLIGRHASMLYADAPANLFTQEEHAHIAEFAADQHMLLELVKDRMQDNARIQARLHVEAVEANAHLLQFGDRTSLQMAMPWESPKTFMRCPVDGEGTYAEMEMTFDEENISFSPWPYAVPHFEVHMHGRLIDQRHFDNEEAYHTALSEASFYSRIWKVGK